MLEGTIYTYAQLTAPGTTPAQATSDGIVYQVVVASINTNVIVQLEASVDGVNYGVIQIGNSSIVPAADRTVTINANGTYIFSINVSYRFIRFNWISESGGVAATLNVQAWVT